MAVARLSPARPSARLKVPAQEGLVVEIDRVDNPRLDPVRVDLFLPGAAAPRLSLSLYPPDRPSTTFLPALPRGVEEIEVRLVPQRGRPLRGSVDVRLAPR